jgi:hypothetical protein
MRGLGFAWAVMPCLLWSAPAVAEPSAGVYLSAQTPVSGALAAAGSSQGYLLIGRSGNAITGQRVDERGVLVDAAALPLLSSGSGNPDVMWDGTHFATVSTLTTDYYEAIAEVGVARLGMTDSEASATQVVAEGLGWPSSLFGACVDGDCTVAYHDTMWLKPQNAWQFTFDTAGARFGVSPVTGADEEVPSDVDADGDRLLVVSRVETPGSEGLDAVWISADTADAPTRVRLVEGVHDLPRVAVGADRALAVWRAAGSGLVAARVERGAGLLDTAPIDLGSGDAGSQVDVAWDGTTFVIAACNPADGSRQLIRVDPEGVLIDVVEEADGRCSHPRITAGPTGHLLWSWFLDDAYRYVAVEADVPDGGACHADQACLSGRCESGICVAEEADPPGDTGATAVDTDVPEWVDSAEPDDTGEKSDEGCGCSSVEPTRLSWVLGLRLLARR